MIVILGGWISCTSINLKGTPRPCKKSKITYLIYSFTSH